MNTPRTDAESWAHPTDGTEVVNATFSRQLERELTAEQEKVKRLRDALEYYAAMKGAVGWPARNALEVNA